MTLGVDVIVAAGTPAIKAAQQATTTIPIVGIAMADPVRDGLVRNYAAPEANITGNTFLGPELVPKRLGYLKELLPDPPPLKWSALRYGFRAKEYHDAEEETQARGDRCEAAPGGCAGVAGAERCRGGTLDWGYGGHVLPLAPGVWRAQERSGQATEGSRD